MPSQADKNRLYIVRQEEAGHGGHHGGSWKVAYADFVTALMALFLLLWLLLALKPQQKKQLASFFQDPDAFHEATVSQGAPVPSAQPARSDFTATTRQKQLLRDISDRLRDFVTKDPDMARATSITSESGGILIRMGASLLFTPGTSQLTAEAPHVLQEVASILKEKDVVLQVRGHTDDSESTSGLYHSRWELSTARAASVVSMLISRFGIDPRRLEAIGYADTQPLVPNDTPENRARNRRVEFFFAISGTTGDEAPAVALPPS
ncbi:OmpA/MotB domain protein [Desulfovibrio sp. X2]|uniref:OmpA/MotB family protein n=1 Tax=Desulfovibrio sp. X2 TaxID=941449 RepID=UPI000358BABE|nr:flagellar motor protein MotB [Desulfovibrio sp. X2]EPR42367.1 OmpA/MotB domain protein [Desulfovibrio sp. X2]